MLCFGCCALGAVLWVLCFGRISINNFFKVDKKVQNIHAYLAYNFIFSILFRKIETSWRVTVSVWNVVCASLS